MNIFFLSTAEQTRNLIIILVVCLVILIGIIINLKKPKSSEINAEEKEEKNLALFQERNVKKDKKAYSNKWLVYKKNIQEYYVSLFDAKAKEVIQSEMFASMLGANNSINTITSLIQKDSYKIVHTIDNKLYILVKYNKDYTIAKIGPFDNINILESELSDIKSLLDTAQKEENISIAQSTIEYKKSKDLVVQRKAYNWKIEASDNAYIGKLYSNYQVILVSEEFVKKNDVKRAIEDIRYYIEQSNIVINIDFENLYEFRIRNKEKITIALSLKYSTYDECVESLNEVITNA